MEPQSVLLERAYREAGHTVMSFVIRNGLTDKFVPMDRSLILPEIGEIAIERQLADWSQITFSLGSLITVPQVLIAGYVAERIKEGTTDENLPKTSSKFTSAIRHIRGYIAEYFDNLDYAQAKQMEDKYLKEMFDIVDGKPRTYWASVEALANALLEKKRLSEKEAFEIIEGVLPAEAKATIKAYFSISDTEYLARNTRKFLDEANQEIEAAKKAGWQFWKK